MNSNKSTQIFNYILIIVFGGLISLPLIFFNRTEGKISEIENKTLASEPKLILADGKINPNYISEYENYFNDNIGFKEEALAANIIMKYKLFHIIDIPNWIMGKEKNLFYTSNGESIKTYCGTNIYTESQMQKMADNLYDMNQYFQQQYGCLTYNMFIPNKEDVYSELYNPYIYHAKESRLDIFCQFLTDNYDLNIINVKDSLVSNKEKQLYYKSCDASHWNMNGAYIGYLDLMSKIQKDLPDIKILKEDDFDISEETYVGLMQQYTGIDIIHNSFDLEDTIYNYNLKSGYKAEVTQNVFDGMQIDPNLNFFHFYNAEVKNKKNLFVVGDSYMYVFMLPMLAESFENVYFIRNTKAETIAEIAGKVEPDVFVFEMVERLFYENYYIDNMSDYSRYLNYSIDLNEYQMIEIVPEVHIDYPVLEDNIINRTDCKKISGWALDTKNDRPPKEVVIEVDGKYRKAEPSYREDLATVDEKYGDCGFDISIDNETINNAREISFYVITEKDEVYLKYSVLLK